MNQLTTTDQHEDRLPAVGGVYGSMQGFEDAQRMAKALSASSLVPADYQGNTANTLIALEMSQRTGSSPMAVMQNLHIIHGRPSWSSQFVIAALNSCGRFSPLRYRVEDLGETDAKIDEWNGPKGQRTKSSRIIKVHDRSCVAWCYDKATGDVLEGPPVSIGMAVAEGWYTKDGSKWVTMPDLMLRYRAAKFFGNLYAPDVLMGMHSADEVEDFGDTGPIHVKNQATQSHANDNKPKVDPIADLNEFGNKHGTRSATDVLDGEVVTEDPKPDKPAPRARARRAATAVQEAPAADKAPDNDVVDAEIVDAEVVEATANPEPTQQQTDAATEPPKDLF
jgi:hypothetical protein